MDPALNQYEIQQNTVSWINFPIIRMTKNFIVQTEIFLSWKGTLLLITWGPQSKAALFGMDSHSKYEEQFLTFLPSFYLSYLEFNLSFSLLKSTYHHTTHKHSALPFPICSVHPLFDWSRCSLLVRFIAKNRIKDVLHKTFWIKSEVLDLKYVRKLTLWKDLLLAYSNDVTLHSYHKYHFHI